MARKGRKMAIYQSQILVISLYYIFANQDRFSNALMQCTAVARIYLVWHMCIFRKWMTCKDSFLIYLYFLLSLYRSSFSWYFFSRRFLKHLLFFHMRTLRPCKRVCKHERYSLILNSKIVSQKSKLNTMATLVVESQIWHTKSGQFLPKSHQIQ